MICRGGGGQKLVGDAGGCRASADYCADRLRHDIGHKARDSQTRLRGAEQLPLLGRMWLLLSSSLALGGAWIGRYVSTTVGDGALCFYQLACLDMPDSDAAIAAARHHQQGVFHLGLGRVDHQR